MNPCARHPDTSAEFQCDACERLLCAECATESHALFICSLCGERALPLGASATQTPSQRQTAAKALAPYSFRDALLYPLRDTGGRFTLAALAGLLALAGFAGGCFFGLAIQIILTLAVAGMQFKIARKTMDGDYEVPYWTDWDFAELFFDWLAWLMVAVLQWGLIVIVVLDYGLFRAMLGEPSLLFWLTITLCGWLGTALGLMGIGAAANYGRWHVFAVPYHFVAFRRAGGDAVATTNLVFACGALIPVVQVLASPVPLVGSIFGVTVGAYWTLVLPHLCGLLFGRNAEEMDSIYM